jgi:hypothetical protein
MATPGELVTKFSEVLYIPHPTMVVVNRFLADAGMLPKGTRGNKSVHRDALDAARLLIAVLGTSSPGHMVDVVNDFGILECREVEFGDAEGLTLETLCGPELGEVHTFEYALEGLIAGFARPDFRALLKANVRHVGRMAHYPDITVRVSETRVAAEISVGRNVYRYYHPTWYHLEEVEAQCPPPPADDAPNAEKLAYLTWADEAEARWMAVLDRYRGVQTERTISLTEIIPIAELIHAPRPKRPRKGATAENLQPVAAQEEL